MIGPAARMGQASSAACPGVRARRGPARRRSAGQEVVVVRRRVGASPATRRLRLDRCRLGAAGHRSRLLGCRGFGFAWPSTRSAGSSARSSPRPGRLRPPARPSAASAVSGLRPSALAATLGSLRSGRRRLGRVSALRRPRRFARRLARRPPPRSAPRPAARRPGPRPCFGRRRCDRPRPGGPLPSGSRWAAASNSRIEPATAALSDPIAPRIGIRTSRSQRRRTAGPRPWPSLPTTIASGPRRSVWRAVSGASASAPDDPQAADVEVRERARRGRRPGTAGGARRRRPRP